MYSSFVIAFHADPNTGFTGFGIVIDKLREMTFGYKVE